MNAYELAVELSGFMTEDEYTDLDKTIFKTCNMLRQQADYIKHLEQGLESSIALNKAQLERLTNLSKNVDELEEELLKATHPNAEPVAWMSPDSKFSKTEGKLFYIPLYTTPQIKELSDEEIQDLIINKVTDADMIRQALRKASEK